MALDGTGIPRPPARPTRPIPGVIYGGSTGGSRDPIDAYAWSPPSLTAAQTYALQNWNPATRPTGGRGGGGDSGGFTPTERPDLGALQQGQIDAEMAAIKAKYNLTRGELSLDRRLLGLDYRANRASSRRTEKTDIEGALNRFAGRGTARSGFAASRLAGIATDAATGRAQALASYTAEKNAIEQQLKQGLIDARGAEEAKALVAINTAFALHQLNEPL